MGGAIQCYGLVENNHWLKHCDVNLSITTQMAVTIAYAPDHM